MSTKSFLTFAGIFLALVFWGCNDNCEPSFVLRGISEKKKIMGAAPYSGEIPIEEAKKMRSYYKTTTNNFKTKYFDREGKVVLGSLEGFRFEASDLEALIKNANGKKAKEIVLYFGRDANDISNGGKTYGSFAIIAMAIDSSGKLAQTAYDKADPCPPYCPDGN